ncbi:MAG: ATP-dependent DNA helicase RecG [Bacteroidota bacterium]|nr:ATP-dependent DNA helicase RecG [Bacteroidota bacterium]
MVDNPLNHKIEFIKGVGPNKAAALKKELGISQLKDMLDFFPFRYEDRSQILKITDIDDNTNAGLYMIQVISKKKAGRYRGKSLKVSVKDSTGYAELVWMKGIEWVEDKMVAGKRYIIYGKPKIVKEKVSFFHPEFGDKSTMPMGLRPVYPSSENLKRRFINNRFFNRIIEEIIGKTKQHIKENLSGELIQNLSLISKSDAVINMHLPKSFAHIKEAIRRLKFEELFFLQLQILQLKNSRLTSFPGYVFKKNILINKFYKEHLPFELTGAQKKVLRECYENMSKGKQMNRLVQGDVGSGKTIVAFLCMLAAIDHDCQIAFMAPTEVLAEQHFNSIRANAEKININVNVLTGSTKQKNRKEILKNLLNGTVDILIGTHALIEDSVVFKRLGLVIIDEQHKFGVAQRAKLWRKKSEFYPHVLVMTATPIPRTLALTLYGDLDVSVIDELPSGRKKIITSHRFDNSRLKVFGFIKDKISLGEQVYVVYPLIEESEKKDYKDLMDGYESLKRYFPNTQIGVLHGRMKPENKDYEMKRFAEGKSKILVSTTVIEVGVDVPNASVIVIESAERFGLSQLHQLRGRVGRGKAQSYCILMTKYTISSESKERMSAMVETNDGFKIANTDLKMRGPGNMMGTKQSGLLELRFTNLAEDQDMVLKSRELAINTIKEDPNLESKENLIMKSHLKENIKQNINWSRIS